ncbi:metal dependent phosphohydrolase [Pontibacter ummariensis]|uniref:Metal dependent phosphohydrolase n=1 Tax=Pontibacter ummariensis TaxID=1610492 RepID=A0A239JNR6_9BACT|nr:HD domain-containing protein [Pontibacter ummariensis]PRY07357.1 metal dependent phosphohydrolase [Pontibacter ummariensis]SNT07487.1 metal dependent phosphohydrolase [Pontibacter ummariensis]
MITHKEARAILQRLTTSESLLRHARTVELVMRAYANKLGEDENKWGNTGLLHDADYQAYPEQHPNVIVNLLREQGEEEMAHAISAHYTKWGVSYNTLLDKALIACDEITGFVVACAQVRPNRLEGLEAKSVLKKLGQKSFAASVDREEVKAGADLFGVDLKEHISFIINVLQQHQEELQLQPQESNQS